MPSPSAPCSQAATSSCAATTVRPST
jgi:hypothetical protein